MGIVYKARHARLRKLVALMMIRTGDFATDFEVKMFQAEARAAAKLDHPGIVPVQEVGMYAGQHFYSMDYVAGPDNRTIATAGEDRTIRLWSIDKPGPEKYFSGHTNTVNRISFNGDGSLLASASVDLSTRIWQIPSELNVATYRGHTDAVSDVAISADSSRIVSASPDGTLKDLRFSAAPV